MEDVKTECKIPSAHFEFQSVKPADVPHHHHPKIDPQIAQRGSAATESFFLDAKPQGNAKQNGMSVSFQAITRPGTRFPDEPK